MKRTPLVTPLAALLAALLLCGSGFAQPLRIATGELPWAIKHVPYETPIEAVVDGKCPEGSVSFALRSGKLPKGIELSGGGLRGTPEETGFFRFTIAATAQCAAATKTLQLFVTGKPVLFVDEREIAFEYKAGGAAPGTKTLLVSSTWPELPYAAVVRATEWLRADPSSGVTPRRGDVFTGDAVALDVDPAKLAPGIYRASVMFYARNGANAPSVPVTLKVLE